MVQSCTGNGFRRTKIMSAKAVRPCCVQYQTVAGSGRGASKRFPALETGNPVGAGDLWGRGLRISGEICSSPAARKSSRRCMDHFHGTVQQTGETLRPGFLAPSTACAMLCCRQSRKAAARDVGHRASDLTHSVDRPASPFGSRADVRPTASRSSTVAPRRLSDRSLRSGRPHTTQAVDGARNAG